MKLVNPIWNRQIELEENTVTILVIEDKTYFREVLKELSDQINGLSGKFLLMDCEKELTISKCVDMTFDYINVEINDKKVLGKIYSNLKDRAVENFDEYSDLINYVGEYIQKLIREEDLDIVPTKNFDPVDLFKSVALEIEEKTKSILERFIEYLFIKQEIIGIKLFVFVNLKTFLTEEEISLLYNTLIENKIMFLILESEMSLIQDNREKLYIIDEDGCEI